MVCYKPALLPRRPQRTRSKRKAIATVELAVCLPILVAISLATIDLCSAMFLKESLTIAAYEGARVGVPKGGTNSGAIQRVMQVLDERDIQYDADAVVITNPGFDGAETMEHVTLTVSVPADQNLLSLAEFFADDRITASVTMRKEYSN